MAQSHVSIAAVGKRRRRSARRLMRRVRRARMLRRLTMPQYVPSSSRMGK